MPRNELAIADVVTLLQRLRDREYGCKWDLQQSWQSLIQYTREEVEELADAIACNDNEKIKEELGDILFNLAFYCQIAEEQSLFDIGDIADGLCEKMIERHPHVFPDGKIDGKRVEVDKQPSIEELNAQWRIVKYRQKSRNR